MSVVLESESEKCEFCTRMGLHPSVALVWDHSTNLISPKISLFPNTDFPLMNMWKRLF